MWMKGDRSTKWLRPESVICMQNTFSERNFVESLQKLSWGRKVFAQKSAMKNMGGVL
jgi:hypothetical protein